MTVKAILICLLAIYAVSAAPVLFLQSSPSTTKITFPLASLTVVSSTLNINPGPILGPGISWITGTINGNSATFESSFYASCDGDIIIRIAATHTWRALLDGVLIGSGGATQYQISTFTRSLSCGSHKLTIIVDGNLLATEAVIFAIHQDQDDCYKCGANGFWDENTCKCNCINKKDSTLCGCKTPFVYTDFPVCGCACPAALPCPAPRYRNLETCKCVCHYKYCDPGYYFEPETCTCFPYLK